MGASPLNLLLPVGASKQMPETNRQECGGQQECEGRKECGDSKNVGDSKNAGDDIPSSLLSDLKYTVNWLSHSTETIWLCLIHTRYSNVTRHPLKVSIPSGSGDPSARCGCEWRSSVETSQHSIEVNQLCHRPE